MTAKQAAKFACVPNSSLTEKEEFGKKSLTSIDISLCDQH
jgi:hypothetical protein